MSQDWKIHGLAKWTTQRYFSSFSVFSTHLNHPAIHDEKLLSKRYLMAQTNSTKGNVSHQSFTYTQLPWFSIVKTDFREFSNPQSGDIVEALRNTQRNQTVVNDFDKPSQKANNFTCLVSQFTDSSFNKGKGWKPWEEHVKNFMKISQESIPTRRHDNSAAKIHFNISNFSWHWRVLLLWRLAKILKGKPSF